MTPSDFYNQYFFANRPVIIRGLMERSKALRTWSPDYLASEFGEDTIEVMSRPKGDLGPHNPTRMRIKDYVRMVKEGGETNDYYLQARNYFFSRGRFSRLLDELIPEHRNPECPYGLLDPRSFGSARLWFGPKGTITQLHVDSCNVLLGQVYGRKLIKMIPPFDGERVYSHIPGYSPVDLGNIDYAKFPWMKGASIIELNLRPGEFMYIPVGWWHWVKALDVSISVTFINFSIDAKLPPCHKEGLLRVPEPRYPKRSATRIR